MLSSRMPRSGASPASVTFLQPNMKSVRMPRRWTKSASVTVLPVRLAAMACGKQRRNSAARAQHRLENGGGARVKAAAQQRVGGVHRMEWLGRRIDCFSERGRARRRCGLGCLLACGRNVGSCAPAALSLVAERRQRVARNALTAGVHARCVHGAVARTS